MHMFSILDWKSDRARTLPNPSRHSPFANAVQVPARVRLTGVADRPPHDIIPVERHRGEIALAHDVLADIVQAVIFRGGFVSKVTLLPTVHMQHSSARLCRKANRTYTRGRGSHLPSSQCGSRSSIQSPSSSGPCSAKLGQQIL